MARLGRGLLTRKLKVGRTASLAPRPAPATILTTVSIARQVNKPGTAVTVLTTVTITPVAIRPVVAVGTLVTAVGTPAQATLTVSPAALGNLLCLAAETKFTAGQNYFVTGVSGGGVAEWTRRVQLLPDAQAVHEITIWTGIVSAPGAGLTLTATYSNPGTVSTTLNCHEFQPLAGSNTTWAFDVGATASNAASTSPPYPSLTPTVPYTSELYFGFIQWPGSGSGGGTPGCIYQTDANGNQCVYNTGVSATIQPLASSASQVSSTAAVLMRAGPVKPLSPAFGMAQSVQRAGSW